MRLVIGFVVLCVVVLVGYDEHHTQRPLRGAFDGLSTFAQAEPCGALLPARNATRSG